MKNFMEYNPEIQHRRSIRLKEYDYSQAGLYFIAVCTRNRLCLFGGIENEEMVLNDMGMMVKTIWDEIPPHYPGIEIGEFVVMPNHVHGIIALVGAGPRACPDQANHEMQSVGVFPRGYPNPNAGPIPHQTENNGQSVRVPPCGYPNPNAGPIPHQTENNGQSVRVSPRGYPNPNAGLMPHQTENNGQSVGVSPRGYPNPNAGPMPHQTENNGQSVRVPPCGHPNLHLPGQPQGVAPTLALPDIVHRFKTMTTKRYTDGVKQYGWSPFPGKLWQRNYYEHIIRDDESHHRISEYIRTNPLRWREDKYYEYEKPA